MFEHFSSLKFSIKFDLLLKFGCFLSLQGHTSAAAEAAVTVVLHVTKKIKTEGDNYNRISKIKELSS